MEVYGINFAAGHWCAGGFLDRFATTGYNPDIDSGIISQIKRVAKAGIKGIEFHESLFIDDDFKKDSGRIALVKNVLKRYNLTPTNMNTNLFTHPKWKLGSITNANNSIRKDTLEVALQGIEIAKEVGCSSVALWPGSDRWDYNFEVNYGRILGRFIEGCIAMNKKSKKAGFEIWH